MYCPKAVIAIGNLPDTLRDRSIIVAMRWKSKDGGPDQDLGQRRKTVA